MVLLIIGLEEIYLKLKELLINENLNTQIEGKKVAYIVFDGFNPSTS